MTTRLTANGAKLQALLTRHVGDPYVWGDDGPHDEDCSGLFYEVMGPSGMNVQAIVHAGRLTANDYYHLGQRISSPSQVGDYFVELVPGTDHAHHIGTYYGTDAAGDEYEVEARGVAYGVVKYRLDDPNNGPDARGGIWMRLPGVNLGPFRETVPGAVVYIWFVSNDANARAATSWAQANGFHNLMSRKFGDKTAWLCQTPLPAGYALSAWLRGRKLSPTSCKVQHSTPSMSAQLDAIIKAAS